VVNRAAAELRSDAREPQGLRGDRSMIETQARPGTEASLDEELDLAFTPLHKRCLGVAVGVALAAALAVSTAVHFLRSPGEPYPLVLLAQFCPGFGWAFDASLGTGARIAGAALGVAWAFWFGFVLGWFFAFARNLVMAATAFVFRARAELAANRGFLDHI
jgi:hypothetical protein